MYALIFFTILASPQTSTSKAQVDLIFQDFEKELMGLEGLQLNEGENGEVVLEGEIYRTKDLRSVEKFLQKHEEVSNKTQMASDALRSIRQQLEKEAQRIDPRAKVRQKGSEFILSGTQSEEILHQLRAKYPNTRLEKVEVSSKIQPSVFLEVVLVEIKKSALKKLGTRLQSPIEFGFGSNLSFFQNSAVNTVDPIRVFLDLAMQNGEARIHAKQSIVTENGRMGEFKVGGEFPIKVVSGIIAKIIFKEFGLILKFTPHLSKPPIVHLSIDSEMSDIDTGAMIDGIPVIMQKHLKTQVFAKLDEMMALGGVVRSSDSKMTDSIPGLSSIPILGRLFQSEDFKRNQSEAYIFITPRRMDQPWLPSPEL